MIELRDRMLVRWRQYLSWEQGLQAAGLDSAIGGGIPAHRRNRGRLSGHEGMRHWWRNLLDAFPDFTVEVGEVRDPGDLTVAAVRLRGQGAGSDTPTEQAVWNVTRWRRGKSVWWRNFTTQEEALEAVGLSEQDVHADSS